MKLLKSFFLILSTMWMVSCSSLSDTRVTSPDGRISLSFTLDEQAAPVYQVDVEEHPFLLPSRLGFCDAEGHPLSQGFQVRDVDFSSVDENWTQPWGENKELRNCYNEMAVTLDNEAGIRLLLRFRLFDDGLGFRYEYDVPGVDSLLLTDELTTFALAAADGPSWSIPAHYDTYELLYRSMPLAEVETANTPMTFQVAGQYASIHEAALTDFPEMTLQRVTPGCFKAELAPWPDGIKARFSGGHFVTPWRTVQLAEEAVGLINSSLLLNLNEPCALPSTDWIRPMKYVGIWWGMHLGIEGWAMGDRHGATTANALRHIDFAAANQIEAVMFEGWNKGWENWGGNQVFDYTQPYEDFDMEKIAAYAAEKGVKIIGHHETGGNIFNYERQLDKAFEWYADYGVPSVKTGYAGGLPQGHNHHGQFNVRHYRKVVQKAAEYHLTIDAHEPIKDTGIRRTYPNMMTREGARGMEWNAWSEGNPPSHHVLLPFTRLLAGPMDYTPGIFDILYERAKKSPLRKQWNMRDSKDCRVNTTLAKQIALWVILYSPLQMASDLIENYEGHPAFQFFRDFDADCDWSKAVAGEPGEYVAIVRRAGEKYFFGAATNEEARSMALKLDFLQPGQTYRAVVYADAPDADWETNPTAYVIREQSVTSNDSLDIRMARGGGQAITFLPVSETE